MGIFISAKGFFIKMPKIPVLKLIFNSVFSFMFNIFSMFPIFAKFIVEVLFTGVIIFKSIYQLFIKIFKSF